MDPFKLIGAQHAPPIAGAFAGGPQFHNLDPWLCLVAEANTLATANGWAKDVFGKVHDLRPGKQFTFTNTVKFDKENALGEKLSEPVWLTEEGGFSYEDENGGAYDLNDAVAAESKEANVQGTQITLVSHVALKTLSASVNGDKASFGRFWSRLLLNMKQSFAKRREIAGKYGGLQLGTVESMTDAGVNSVITISFPTWAPGFFNGARNARIQAYNGPTLLNDEGELKITAVNIKERKISVTGDADDIDAMLAIGTAGSGVTLYWKGAKGKDGTGARLVADHSSGLLYNINTDTYPDLWAATQIDALGAPLSWTLIQSALEEAAGRGCEARLILEVSQRGFSQLATDINALRVMDASYKENAKVGTRSITFLFHTGEVEIVPSNYQWMGDAIGYPDPNGEDGSDSRFVGTTDVTFMNPDKGGEMFSMVPGKNAVELRAYADLSYYSTQIRDHLLIKNLGG